MRRLPRPLAVLLAIVLAVVLAGGLYVLKRKLPSLGIRARIANLFGAGPKVAWQSYAAARPTPNGGVILAWAPAGRADHYVVVFFGEDGRQLDRIGGIETLELVLTRDALPRNLPAGAQVSWSVVALKGDRALGTSPAQSLQLP